MIRIRVDDFPQTRGESQHTLTAFREFHKTLTECIGGKRYLLGVIPGRMSVDDVLFLRNETDCVIGMHGIDHDEAKLDRFQNEFPPYLSQPEIGRLLKEGRESLISGIGRSCVIYMPPRNRIDLRTVMMLSSAGFTWCTSGPETDPSFRKLSSGFHPHPSRIIHSESPHEYGRTDELTLANSHLNLIDKCENERDVVLTLHWTWETNIGLGHMIKFLALIPKKYFGDFDE